MAGEGAWASWVLLHRERRVRSHDGTGHRPEHAAARKARSDARRTAASRDQGPRQRAVQGHRPGDGSSTPRATAADARGRARSCCAAAGTRTRSRSATARTARRPGSTAGRPRRPSRARARASRSCPGPVFAAPYHFAGDAEGPASPTTRRDGQPDLGALGGALGELEGGEAVVFASGMAAISAVLLTRSVAGRRARRARATATTGAHAGREHLARRGVEVRLVASEDGAIREALAGARLLWIETPSNPLLDVVDVERAGGAPRTRPGRWSRSTTRSRRRLRQRPLELGADFSVASAAKELTGHSDLMLGHVAVRDPELAAGLRAWRTHGRRDPGAVRDMARAPLARDARAARRAPGAQRRRRSPSCCAPRRTSHVRPLAGRRLRRLLRPARRRARAQAFLGACRLVAEATSFGGVHSSAERRARWGGDDISAGARPPERRLRGRRGPARRRGAGARRSAADERRAGDAEAPG